MGSTGQPWQSFSNLNPGQVLPLCACHFAIYLENVALPGAEKTVSHEKVWQAPLASPGNLRGPAGKLSLASQKKYEFLIKNA
jgi:hypothetical protein